MEQVLLRSGHAAVLFLEVLVLAWIGKRAAQLASRTDFRLELMTRDNPAAGVVLGGFYVGLFTALSGLLSGDPSPSLGADLLLTAAHGGVAIAALLVSAALWRPVLQVDFTKDVIEGRNAGAALVAAAALVATGLIYRGALAGESESWASVAAFFAIGESALLLAILYYEWITPYGVYEEVGERANMGAALGASGAILASGLIIGNAVRGDFVSWELSIRDSLVYMIPVAGLPLVRWIVVNGLLLGGGSVNREITEDRNAAAGAVEGAAYIGTALFLVELL